METRGQSPLSDSSAMQINHDSNDSLVSASASEGIEALKDIMFGSVAGAAGKVVEYPFDTVKVRLQSQPDSLPLRYKGPLDCFRQSFAAEGIVGLYRGVSAPLTGAAAETASLFFSYRVAQKLLHQGGFAKDDELSLPMLALAGAMSGGVTSLILTPIELVKCRMQVPLHSLTDLSLRSQPGAFTTAPLSPFAVIREVYRREGLRGFWRGQLGTFFRETGGSAAWFGTYEASSAYFRQRLRAQRERSAGTASNESADVPIELRISQQMASGALAGVNYNFLFFPADTIKSKMQTGELSHIRPTFREVAKALWRAHGIKGLYRGCGITVVRSAPSSALIFTIMGQLKTAFQ